MPAPRRRCAPRIPARTPPSAAGARTCFQVPAGAEGLARKKFQKHPEKCCYSLSPIPCPTRRSRSGCLWHKWLRHLLPVEPTCDIVLPPDRPSLPPRQNSAARRLRRQTLRRRAGACICSVRGRRTPNARTEETAGAMDSDAYSAVGRRRSDLLPGAGRCGRSRQKKTQKNPEKMFLLSIALDPTT